MQKLFVVYPPDDMVRQGTEPGWDRVAVYHSLDEIPLTITRNAGFRCFEISIPECAAIAGGGAGFFVDGKSKELLEDLDRERFSDHGIEARPETSVTHVAGEEDRATKGDAIVGVVILHSPVDGIPPTHLHVLQGEPGELPLFQVKTAMDVKSLEFGALVKVFDPPITLQAEIYQLGEDLVPHRWQTQSPKASAAG